MPLAPLYDFAVLDNADQPRSIIYNVDTGQEVMTLSTNLDDQKMVEMVCNVMNEYMEKEQSK